MSGAVIIVLLCNVIVIAIAVMIGFYVYRDAGKRGINAVLWTLISVLTPLLVGFIIYLLVRSTYSDLKCPNCGAFVKEQYRSCPGCGARLKPFCPACGAPVEKEWSFCPVCASPLPEKYEVLTPVREKDKTLGRILAAVILISVLLPFGIVFVLSVDGDRTGGTGVTSLPVSEYLEEMQNPALEEWLNQSGEYYRLAYVLRQVSSGEELRVRYLIYLPCLTEDTPISIGSSSDLFGRTVKLTFPEQNGNSGNTLVLVTYTGEKMPRLKLYYGNKKIDCEITDVNYPLGLTENSQSKEIR